MVELSNGGGRRPRTPADPDDEGAEDDSATPYDDSTNAYDDRIDNE